MDYLLVRAVGLWRGCWAYRKCYITRSSVHCFFKQTSRKCVIVKCDDNLLSRETGLCFSSPWWGSQPLLASVKTAQTWTSIFYQWLPHKTISEIVNNYWSDDCLSQPMSVHYTTRLSNYDLSFATAALVTVVGWKCIMECLYKCSTFCGLVWLVTSLDLTLSV